MNLRELIENSGKTITEISREALVSESNIYQILRGDVDIEKMRFGAGCNLAQAIGCSPINLLAAGINTRKEAEEAKLAENDT